MLRIKGGVMDKNLDYEKEKYKEFKKTIEEYKLKLKKDREIALDMPIETDNGFNVERERLIDDIDEKLGILNRHKDDPYFAKLLFKDIEDGEEFNGYIGRVSIGQISDPSDNKIVDWRAPIADLYYNGRIGHSSYKSLEKEYTVDLKLKRQIKCKDDDVESIYDLDDKISNDEFLIPYLTQSADNRLKNIVATIQQEQNDIIRCSPYQNLVVQGVAGSGKTTVALHRLSYVIYNYKKVLSPSDLLIISPNEIFLHYISTILVDLEADKSNSFSLNKIVNDLLQTDYELLAKHHQFSCLQKEKVSTDYLSYKNSKNFMIILESFLKDFISNLTNKPLIVKGVKLLDGEDLKNFFIEPNIEKPIEKVIDDGCKRLGIALSTETELKRKAILNIDKSDKDFSTRNSIKELMDSGNFGYIRKTIKTNFNVLSIYKDFVKSIEKYSDYKEIQILKKYTLKNLTSKRIAYDDYASLLYLITRLIELPFYNRIRCVFIDEAQDLSELMFVALKQLFKFAKFSIFGDIAQGIYDYEAIKDWSFVVDNFEETKMLFLNRSYRTSVEIMMEANKDLVKLGLEPANNVVRHGEQVEFENNHNIETIKKWIDVLNIKFNNTAIICKDELELAKAQQKLKDLNLVVINEDNSSYNDNKNILLSVQTAKGLEFDSVIIYNSGSFGDSGLDLKQLYVAKTRALHKLIICK